ncbi:uncharacterized protein [Setaria viridis]|uniref:Uncharacterized protein n=1 Tax=Setaria viridis TaxID=4556 RepID=A0A4U6VUN2_SETVI|nr:uncharacterized protein LOC117846594 [Setaria viridis]TKW32453.1 hypothetical protein SEVIR_2G169300v2 [Setaria viridis]
MKDTQVLLSSTVSAIKSGGWEARQVTHKRPHYKASQLAKKKKKVVGRKKGVPTTTATAETASGAGSGAPSLVAQGGEPKLGGTTANDAAYLKDILKERMRGGSSGDAPNPPQELRSKFRLFTKSTLASTRSDDGATQLERCPSQAEADSGCTAWQLLAPEVGVGVVVAEVALSSMPQQVEVSAKVTDNSVADLSVVLEIKEEAEGRGVVGDGVQVGDVARGLAVVEDAEVEHATQGDAEVGRAA